MKNQFHRDNFTTKNIESPDHKGKIWEFWGSNRKFNLFIIVLIVLIPMQSVEISYAAEEKNWPTARGGHKMVYLPLSNQIFLFGGVSNFSSGVLLTDTWIFNANLSEWTCLQTENHPSPRWNHALVYEPSQARVFLFGGMSVETQMRLSDTWVFDLASNDWELIEIAGPMVNRSDGCLVYEPIIERILLFGGCDQNEIKLNDLWFFDHSNRTWYEMEQTSVPPSRYGHEMVYCQSQNSTYFFGGRTPTGTTNDFYKYNSTSNIWTEVVTEPKPGIRYWHTMEYFPEVNHLILYGGRDSEYIGASVLGDTWLYNFNLNLWTEIETQVKPPPLVSTDMVCLPSNGKYLMFGGTMSISEFQGTDNMWEFDYYTQTWREIINDPPKQIKSYPISFFVPLIFILVSINVALKKEHIESGHKKPSKDL